MKIMKTETSDLEFESMSPFFKESQVDIRNPLRYLLITK